MTISLDNTLTTIARFTGARVVPDASAPLNSRLAGALGWGGAIARVETERVSRTSIDIASGFLGSERALVIAGDGIKSSPNLVDQAALFTYHSSVRWGVFAGDQGAVIYNSHWIRDQSWFTLPRFDWNEFAEREDILTSLSPRGIAEGSLDKIASSYYQPDRLLTPVDDALVERLSRWRRDALRYGTDIKGLDEAFHTLFAQMFVLRAVEDRNLAPGIGTLVECLAGSEVDVDKLANVFEQARQEIQSELFANDPTQRIPRFVLAGVINDLYFPSQLPAGSRYNFEWIDSDVLGNAYEKYVATIYSPVSPSPQMSLFDQPSRELEPISVQKAGGVFYTPGYLVGTLTTLATSEVLEGRRDTDFIPTIADFACGSGSFLVAALGELLQVLKRRDPNVNWPRYLIEKRHIIGIDVNPQAVTDTRMNLWLRFTGEPDPLPLPSIEKVIVVGDSLGDEVWNELPPEYDVVLGNPPFIAIGNTKQREELRKRFRTAQGRYDYAHLFVELAISKLAPSGVLGMVVPNRIFRNQDAGFVRELIAAETDLLSVIDFGTNEVFEKTSAYIGAIVARKRPQQSDHPREHTRAMVVKDLSAEKFLSAVLTQAMFTPDSAISLPSLESSVSIFDIPHPVGTAAWALLTPEQRLARVKLQQDATTLGAFARIYQGIRTGANDLFMFTVESSDGKLARVINGIGDSTLLEVALLHPVVYGSDIRRYDAVRTERMLLYPYSNGRLLTEKELRADYPNVAQYLLHNQELLAARGSIQSSGLRWYELVRKREEQWLQGTKLLTRDLAVRTSFALDLEGSIFLVGGTAVVPQSIEYAFPLLGYLNSSIVNEFLIEITPAFRNSFQKFEPQHLNRVPVPSFIVDLDDTALRIGELAQEIVLGGYDESASTNSENEDEIDRLIRERLQL